MHLFKLVLDPVVSRVDLANQVEPLLLLYPCDSAILSFSVKSGQSLIILFFFLSTLFIVFTEIGPLLTPDFIAKAGLDVGDGELGDSCGAGGGLVR